MTVVRYFNSRINTYDLHPQEKETETKLVTAILRKETKLNIKLFKHADVMISYRTNNTVKRLLANKYKKNDVDIYNENGIYALKCSECEKRYVGQTEISFRTRFTERLAAYKQQNYNSKFAQHLLENRHPMGPIEDIMEAIQVVKTGQFINVLEKLHIYKETCMN
ncbi:hypothetical protein Cfor_07221 [Coptotermes formosanus]|uniref:GIY-YIG domain-containing protein n=1 Tax=Coptotermes formosanus TaxID=36987 RepID=A0A6L2QDY9_COPFO|nr:hypothetical protein Cfor_07221 [Coptotermes formosanus]